MPFLSYSVCPLHAVLQLLTIVHDDERVWVLSSLDSWEVGRRDGVGVLADTSRSVARADHLRVRRRALPRAPPGCPCVDDLALLPPATENLGKLSCWLVLLLLGSIAASICSRDASNRHTTTGYHTS